MNNMSLWRRAAPTGLVLLIVMAVAIIVPSAYVYWFQPPTPTRHNAGSGALGPPVTFSLPIGGRSAWGYPTKTQSHLYDAWRGSFRSRCKHPTSPETWVHGRYQQTFQYCVLVESPARMLRATPITQPIIPGPVGPTVTPVPVATAGPSTPNGYLLGLINDERQKVGSAPLTLDSQLSACALAHSQRMASEGMISHDGFPQPDLCTSGWHTAGQNVGMASGDEYAAIKLDFDQMMGEGHTPLGSCQGGHDCAIAYSGYSQIGVGVYQNGQATWITETMTG